MKNITNLMLLFVLLLSAACKHDKKEKVLEKEGIATKFAVEILDDRALTIIDPKARIDTLASGFEWTEGPLWVSEGNYLLFSDIPNNKVYKWDVEHDTVTYLHPSGFSGAQFEGKEPGSNGLLMNNKGALVLMQHGNRQVAKMKAPMNDPSPDFETLVDNYKGKRLNSPNDGAFDSTGNLYFTDPPYGLPGQMEDPQKELDYQGVYCLMATGELVMMDSLTRPNGIALSPDESVLYVAVSDEKHAVWYAYDVVSPGNIKNRKLFYEVTQYIGKEGEQGLPDGMKVNKKGVIFATGPGGIWIFAPEGKALARIHTGQRTANCAFTTDQKRLIMTADDYLLAIDLK